MATQKALRFFSGVAAAAAFIISGCGGANLAPDCEGFTGQYGAPGSDPATLANRVVRVYSITNCDAAGANCTESLIDTVLTGNDGKFRVDNLVNGNYRVRTFSVDGTQLLNTNTVNLPAVCRAVPSPTPSS